MGFFEKDLKDLVRDLLVKYPVLRDNDSRLLANVWAVELKTKFGGGLTAHTTAEFFVLLALGDNLTPAETITRCRRKIQEEEPALRGEKWKKRKERAEDVRMEMRA